MTLRCSSIPEISPSAKRDTSQNCNAAPAVCPGERSDEVQSVLINFPIAISESRGAVA